MKPVAMKQITMMLVIASLATGCGTPKLKKEEASRLIKKEFPLPRTVDHDVYTADPKHARRLLDAGLETNGYVTIKKTQTFGELGNPLITFTEKSQPYLLPKPEEDLNKNIQKVKVADEHLVEISSIEQDKNTNTAMVHYSTLYKNQTPFVVLLPKKRDKPKGYTAKFVLTDGVWVIERLNW